MSIERGSVTGGKSLRLLLKGSHHAVALPLIVTILLMT